MKAILSLKSRIPSQCEGEGSLFLRESKGATRFKRISRKVRRDDRDPSLRFGVTQIGAASELRRFLGVAMVVLTSLNAFAGDSGPAVPLPSSGNVTLTL